MSGVSEARRLKPLLSSLLSGTALGVVLTAAASLPAKAQTSGEPTQMPAVTSEATVPGQQYKTEQLSSPKYTEPLLDTPQSVTVIPRKLMDEQGVRSLADALRTVPGVTIGAGEGGGPQGDNLRIRGFTANTDIYVDGIRDIGQYARDPFDLDSVEVVKGPNSTYFGRGTTGGYVNQVSKTPRLDTFYNGDVSLGTDMTKRVTADVNHPLDWMNGAVRLNAMVHDADVAERDYIENKRWGVAPSLALGIGQPTRLNLNYFHLHQNNVPDYGIPVVNNGPGANGHPAPVDRSNFYGLADYQKEVTTDDQITLKIEHDFEDAATVRSQVRYSYDQRYAVVYPPRSPNLVANTVSRNNGTFGQLNNGNLPGRDGANSLLINTTDVTARFKAEDVQLTTVNGIEFARETYDNLSFSFTGVPDTSLTNPNSYPAYSRPRTLNSDTSTSSNSWGAFTLNTLKFYDVFELIGGFRYDYFETDSSVHQITASNTVPVGTTNLNRKDSLPSYKISAVYKPEKNGSVYFSYGTSSNPSAEALTLSNTATSTNNANLAPESNKSYEFGTKWDVFDSKLQVSSALFRIEKTNARTEDPNNPNDVVVLEGVQRVNGFEVGAAGNVTKEWAVFGGYTFINGKVTESKNPNEVGKRLNNTPAHSFSLWTTYQLPLDVQVGFGTQYLGHRYINNANTAEVDAYWLFNAMVGYKITDNINVQLNIYNLTDEYYYAGVHNGGGHVIPGAGRSALLTTSFHF